MNLYITPFMIVIAVALSTKLTPNTASNIGHVAAVVYGSVVPSRWGSLYSDCLTGCSFTWSRQPCPRPWLGCGVQLLIQGVLELSWGSTTDRCPFQGHRKNPGGLWNSFTFVHTPTAWVEPEILTVDNSRGFAGLIVGTAENKRAWGWWDSTLFASLTDAS